MVIANKLVTFLFLLSCTANCAGCRCPEGLPEAGDDVLIDKNVHVLFDTQTPRLGVIDIVEDGLLEFEDGAEDDEKLILQV